MAILGNNLKTAFLKGMEALGKGAASLTSTAQQKLSEMNLENRRSDLMKEIPVCAAQLWKDGAELPEALSSLIAEMCQLDEQLAAMRVRPEAPAQPEAEQTPAAEPTVEEAVDNVEDAIEEAVETAGEVVEAMVEDVKDAVEGFFKKDDEAEGHADDAE